MAGTESGAPFQRIEELEQENEVLRERLKQAEEDMERLQRENEQLRKELEAAGRGSRHGRRKPKADPKRPGRKAGQGSFTFRKAIAYFRWQEHCLYREPAETGDLDSGWRAGAAAVVGALRHLAPVRA